jgi:hypothetical protein
LRFRTTLLKNVEVIVHRLRGNYREIISDRGLRKIWWFDPIALAVLLAMNRHAEILLLYHGVSHLEDEEDYFRSIYGLDVFDIHQQVVLDAQFNGLRGELALLQLGWQLQGLYRSQHRLIVQGKLCT